jgi:hypothetical protein
MKLWRHVRARPSTIWVSIALTQQQRKVHAARVAGHCSIVGCSNPMLHHDHPCKTCKAGVHNLCAQACLFCFLHHGGQAAQELQVYKWSGENCYIQICDANMKMIAFGEGGEEGAFGLSLEHDF